ncbi:MAG: HAD family hydrolase [Mitsuokella sp.]|uniref:HAD family hydrolase n=1 Tax=Mitsuokella sp. TaxID=2049034 RepID=UPI003F0369E3
MQPAAFIFDMDGVILDSEPIHSRVKMDTFHHFGLPFDEADLIYYMGRTSNEIFGEVIAKEGRKDLSVEELVCYKHEHYLEVLQSGAIKPIEGSVALIKKLYHKGIPLALATSSWEKVMETVLDAFAIRPYFKSVISGSTLPKSKPDPAIYLLSAEKLGVSPAECMVLEDTAAGVLAAKRAGMYCIGFRSPHSGRQDLSLADTVVNHLDEIRI